MLEDLPAPQRIAKTEFATAEAALRIELINAQYDLRQRKFPVIILIAGDDRVGINGAVQLLHDWMDARYLVTRVFTGATEEEQQRPLFWRYWRNLPPAGRIGIHVGSWATGAVRDRLDGRIDATAFASRLGHIRQFENELTADGVLLLKFWLHITRSELGRRLRRFAGPDDEAWQVEKSDRQMYRRHAETVALIEDMLAATDVPQCPWHLIRSSDKRHLALTLTRTIRDNLSWRLAHRHKPERRARARPRAQPPDMLGSLKIPQRALSGTAYTRSRKQLQGRLGTLTRQARDSGRSTVLVFEGLDASGKGGAIRRLTRAMSVRDYRVIPVGAPVGDEQHYHYLWRFWRHLLPAGQMLIFDRSWYGRVLVERVEGLAKAVEWQRAYTEINDFEQQLTGHGIVLRKFWLQIDRDEQLRRFQAREQTPYKQYKITDEDYRNREQWDAYIEAANEMIELTSTHEAPWVLVPANDKRRARIEVLKTVCAALEK